MIIKTILLLFFTGFFSTAHASLVVRLAKANTQDTGYNFSAINHVLISDSVDPLGPSPGDTFIANGFGVLDSQSEFVELTYSYNIAARFTGATQDGKLLFEHGIEMEGVSNQLELYVDIITPFHSRANENDAASYTDGSKSLTMEVLPLADEKGFFNLLTGQGKDRITFKLIDSEKEENGIVNNDLLLKISSEVMLVDFSSGLSPEAFNFGAFDNACGSLENPLDSCSREAGKARLTMAHAPIPSAFGLLLTGFGLLSWVTKRNKLA
jgi:hypothetical protein